MRRGWPVLVVVAAFAGLGLANALKDRGRAESARDAQARLDALPHAINGWTGADAPFPEKQLQIARAEAHLYRTYARPGGGPGVNVLMLYGEPGDLGAHTPEVCFRGAGYSGCGKPEKRAAGDAGELWYGAFETGGVPPARMTVYWGWGADGAWRASDNARADFAGRRKIYKLYVSAVVPPAGGPADKDAAGEFVGPLLAALTPCLSPPTPSDAAP